MNEQNLENTPKPQKENRFKAFLKRKDIEISAKRYGIDAMGSMALGLFGSLLIGTIFKAIGLIPFLSVFAQIGGYAQAVAGPAMAVAIAYALKAPPLVLFPVRLIRLPHYPARPQRNVSPRKDYPFVSRLPH